VSSWDSTYREIQARFVARTREWIAEIRGVVDELERNPADATALGRLTILFHRIAGSAGTYGLPRVSELADEGERSCLALETSGVHPTPEDLASWRRLADEIRENLSTNSH
jgi:HPt (histidine-containing phosphotransfer) domain-containing protein